MLGFMKPLYQQQYPENDTCWINSLSTVTGIDVELLQHDMPPTIFIQAMIDTYSGKMYVDDAQLLELEPWKVLLDDLGYHMIVNKGRPPWMMPHMQSMMITGDPWYGHIVAVDALGQMYDGTDLDGHHVGFLDANCNIIKGPSIWFKRKAD